MNNNIIFGVNAPVYRDSFCDENNIFEKKKRKFVDDNSKTKSSEELLEGIEAIENQCEQEKKKSAFNRFWQFNDAYYEALTMLSSKSNGRFIEVLFFVCHNMDNYNQLICSNVTLAYIIGCSKATIERSIKYLKDHNYIDCVRSGNERSIIVNPKLIFRSWGKNQKYVKFEGEILIDEEDQIIIEEKRKRLNEYKVYSNSKSAMKQAVLIRR